MDNQYMDNQHMDNQYMDNQYMDNQHMDNQHMVNQHMVNQHMVNQYTETGIGYSASATASRRQRCFLPKPSALSVIFISLSDSFQTGAPLLRAIGKRRL